MSSGKELPIHVDRSPASPSDGAVVLAAGETLLVEFLGPCESEVCELAVVAAVSDVFGRTAGIPAVLYSHRMKVDASTVREAVLPVAADLAGVAIGNLVKALDNGALDAEAGGGHLINDWFVSPSAVMARNILMKAEVSASDGSLTVGELRALVTLTKEFAEPSVILDMNQNGVHDFAE